MGSKWEKIKLKEVVDIITTKVDVSQISLCDYISTENMLTNFGGISIANSKPSTGKITKFHSGDILFSNIRTYFKKLWLADRTGGCSNDVIVFRPKKNINSNYILSVLMDQKFIEHTVLTSKGTKMPRGDKTAILDYEFNLAPDKYCQHIAKTNTLIFSKLKSNEVINKSLEQMSQTLFKSWFVDFDPVIDNALDAGNPIPEALKTRAKLRQKVRNSADFKPLPAEIRSLFPSEFEETELGWVPKGWNISLAGEEFIVKGGSTPSTANEDFWINGTIHWTSPKDLTGNQSKVLLDTAKKITPLGLTKISSGLLPVNTVLMSSRAPIGYLAISKVPMAINQGYIAIPSAKHLSPEYTIYWLDNIMDDIKGMAGGTTFAEISKSAFKTIKLLIPSSDIITEFSRITRNHFDMVVQNTKEIDSLTNLRDTLLPKLISGELSLDDLPDLSTDTEAA
ncbi:restriction endonuclease subunit S [Escherichia coli]|uniref:restriction endonuclease subunit S n=1 Tax=Escherichia TaxID=561 RepID=UPI001594468E|nr:MULTISPECIES: restriction endonuclease subunit S [Escherichia]EGO3565949.1 restriction endonuclease subunit S [Escherichia coli]EGO5194481.1 restriction endonuclease subunit S [Escherichia coli]EGO6532968.1 restriction endonuclease subunit S [Escherichia coli]EGO6595956.1 restriction endonuclease subunit S [Escherichia coli]EGO7480272.1 restriction endonuclease subunit S [Escherichia coli]